MFISISEETHDNELRRTRTFCKDCEQYVFVKLVERVRTVTAYWVLKSTERHHFLICDACQAQFRLKPNNKDELDQADIHTLLAMAGNRYVPFSTSAMLFLAVISVPVPLLNLLLVWAASRNKAWFTPGMHKVWRFAFWAALAVNAALVLFALLEKPLAH